MKRLHLLAKQLKENNFEMTPQIKEQFEEYLSIIAEGSRILHPRFGLGTVKSTSGESWVTVQFDRDVKDWEMEQQQVKEEIEGYKLRGESIPWTLDMRRGRSKPSRSVHITSCHSMHMIIKKEMNR